MATATSELARNAFRYASDGTVEFQVTTGSPQFFVICLTDSGPGIANLSQIFDGKYVSRTGLGRGIIGARRLMDHFEISSTPRGTHIQALKRLPPPSPLVDMAFVGNLLKDLARGDSADPFDEVERQNQELLKTLAELREKQDQLAELNSELEDTNRGVVALYAELDQNADDLRRVSDLKTRFLSNISHEFRTPLNSITSLCHLLLSRSDGELTVEQEKQIGYIQRSAAELTELVNDLLDLAKVEAGKIEVRPKHFEVQDLFGSLRGMLKPLLTGNSLELIFDADPGYPPLYTDEGKLSQILRNLISNALKFTRRGYVRLSAELDGSFIAFRVEDTGIGIDPADRERIFEEFTQIDSELQAKVKGTGLGLPLSRRLAELLGGSLDVKSQVGVGSTFYVRLPIHYGDSDLEEHQAPATAVTETNGATVLFIEDSRETNFVHESSLRTSNFNLLFARSLLEARLLLKDAKPSLIALDRFLDEEDSLFFIQELKRNGYGGPIIVISVVDDAQAALGAGADRFLAKPVAPFKLVSTLRELLEGEVCRSILLADDDEVSRYLLADTLTRLGYSVVEARGGREAIQIMEGHILAGVFLDIVMPDLTGFEVLREMRRRPLTATIPVIVHSSLELTEDEINSLTRLNAVVCPKRELGRSDDAARLQRVLATAGIGM